MYKVIVYYYNKFIRAGMFEFKKEIEAEFNDIISYFSDESVICLVDKNDTVTFLPQNRYIEIKNIKEEKDNE